MNEARGTSSRVDGLRELARWLDRLDPVFGLLVPGAGDLAGTLFGLWIVRAAWSMGASRVVVARMVLNLALDAVVGVVPVLGDIFDFAFAANTRNIALLEARHESRRARPSDWLWVGGAAVALVVALLLPLGLLVLTIRWLF